MDDVVAATARPLTVAFAGERSVSSPLTWAQEEIWSLRRQVGPMQAYFNFQHLIRVPPECDVDDVLRAVRRVVGRYEALRTTIRVDQSGHVRQDVHDRGEFRVDVVDAAADHFRVAVGDVWDRVISHTFDDSDWGLRPTLVTSAGQPAVLVLGASHVMLDWYALSFVVEDLEGLLRGVEPGEVPAWHPVDQAGAEASERGQRTARRSVAFWRDHLRTMPPTMFPVSGPVEARMWPCVEMRSPALAVAARLLADRHGQSGADIVLAATALLAGLRAGTSETALRLITANRFTPELRRMVGTCAQSGLLVVDLADCAFSEFIDRTWAASMQAMRHSRYPGPLLREALKEVNQERGTALDVEAFFHNMTDSEPATELPEGAATPEALAEATSRTTLRRGAMFPRCRRFNLEVRDVSQGMTLRLEANPNALSRADAEAYLRAVEKLVVHAAHQDVRLSAVADLTGLRVP